MLSRKRLKRKPDCREEKRTYACMSSNHKAGPEGALEMIFLLQSFESSLVTTISDKISSPIRRRLRKLRT